MYQWTFSLCKSFTHSHFFLLLKTVKFIPIQGSDINQFAESLQIDHLGRKYTSANFVMNEYHIKSIN